MHIGDLPLTRIFWSIFTVEALVIVIMLVYLLFSLQSGPNGGAVGAWLIVIPIAALAIVAGVFLVAKAPWVRVICILFLLLPVLVKGLGIPLGMVRQVFEDRAQRNRADWSRRAERGEFLFQEEGQRRLAVAIAAHNIEGVKAALPGAGDLDRIFSEKLPDQVASGDTDSLLSFACERADDSDASAQVIRLLLGAGANPNLPSGKPLYNAISRSSRVTEILLEAGADPNVDDGSGGPIWWSVLEMAKWGEPDIKMLQMLIAHGADTTKRKPYTGPIEIALEKELWAAIVLLAPLVPGGGKNLPIGSAIAGEARRTVHDRLTEKVKTLQGSGGPVPEELLAALTQVEKAAK